jgi:SAM-dependent methyltransferase
VTRVPPRFFDELYADDPDPWEFATSAYERDKYRATIDALGGRRYAAAFEAGCSIGVLTVALADIADRLLAVDAAPAALEQARARTAGLSHVGVEQASLPEDWPAGPFDLVVLSEVAYYFDSPTLDHLLDAAIGSLGPGGDLIAVHWTGVTDYPLAGDAVHERLRARPELEIAVSQRTDRYRLDVGVRR